MTFFLGMTVWWFVSREVSFLMCDVVLGGQFLRTHEVSIRDCELGR